MTTTIGRTGRRVAVPAALAARAVLCAALALVVTFSQDQGKALTSADRDPRFGLVVVGVFLLLQAVLLAGSVRVLPVVHGGVLALGARAVVSALGGVVALALSDGGVGVLVPLEAAVLLLLGALEVTGGLRRLEATTDGVVVGGAQLLAALLLVTLARDALFAIGVVGAWGAVAAVFLGIAAVSQRRREVAA